MLPKGKLLLIGGAEDKGGRDKPDIENQNIRYKHYDILKSLLSVSKKSIAIITSASRVQDEIRRTYLKAFRNLGYEPRFIQIHDKRDTCERRFLADIENMGSVFFTGGDQSRLTSIFFGTQFIKIIRDRYLYDPEFLVAGTSAGAMALSDIMIAEGQTEEAILAKKIKIYKGFGLIKSSIIDTHFIKRARFPRLTYAVLRYPEHLGIGLGEDTALIIKKGYLAECRGSGMVLIIDGSHLRKTNIDIARKGEPIFAENLKVHILVKGNHFSLRSRRLID